jgi:hypothetical protein
VRQIVKSGVEQGWGRESILKELREKGGAAASGLSSNYLRIVSDAMVSRSRTFSALSTYQGAEVVTYQVESVLDTNTCNRCRYMHGQVLSAEHGLGRYAEADAKSSSDPLALKAALPWLTEKSIKGGAYDGKLGIYAPSASGMTRIAVVEQSSFGKMDDRGKFGATS